MVITRTDVSPIQLQNPIVDPKTGSPTLQFLHLFNLLLQNEFGTNKKVKGAELDIDVLDATKADKETEILAGAGLTGGGDLSVDRTLNVGAGTGITVNADDVAIDLVAEAERIRDTIAAALQAGMSIGITVDDAGDTITINHLLTISTNASNPYTLVLGDAGKHIRFTTNAACAVTIPPNSSVAFVVGTRIRMTAAGTGQITLTPGSGVTLNSRGAALKSAGQYAVFEVEKVGTNEWDVLGDVTT